MLSFKQFQEEKSSSKKKNDKNIPFEGPYKKDSGTIVDKSGAKHTAMSLARHLARAAMKKVDKK